jgi:hypothetical protein
LSKQYRASSNYSDFLKRHLHLRNRLLDQGYKKICLIRSLIDKKIFLTFLLISLSLYIFTIWKCIVYHRLCRDGIYFDKTLVSEYRKSTKMSKIFFYQCKIIFDICFTGFGTALTTILPILFQYCYKYCWQNQFSGCWLILSVYILMSFDFPFVRLFGIR